MKTSLLQKMNGLLFLACLYLTLPALSAEAPHTEVIRDARGAIVERWVFTQESKSSIRVTVRDAAGKILRTYILPTSRPKDTGTPLVPNATASEKAK